MAKTHETKTILVIEDETVVQNFASRLLELEGYHILYNGRGRSKWVPPA